MQNPTIKEKTQGLVGTIRVRRYRAGTIDLASPYYKAADTLKKAAEASTQEHERGLFFKQIARYKARAQEILDAGFIELAVVQKNLIVSSNAHGKNIIARVLGSDNTYTLNVGYGEIGTGTTAPALTDVALTTPTVRAAVSTGEVSNNIVTLRFFYANATLADGTYNEFGTFCGGSITIGTGQLFNHALFSSPYAKAAGQDTSVDVEIDVN